METKHVLRLIRAALLMVIIICLIPIGQAYVSTIKHGRKQEQLKLSLKEGTTPADTKPDRPNTPKPNTDTPEILSRFQGLYAENNDLAGWLRIDGTNIDYPVMQCEDDEYYLDHDFYGQKDKYGCLFVRKTADIHTPCTNFIIYGHNMKDGLMFGKLNQYESEAFYKEHPLISFDTLYEERIYEIIAAFPSQIYADEENVFKYYEFYQADTEEEFQYFYGNIKDLSLYDTGVTAMFGDTFLTLSTCSSHGEDGRFVVVAKRTANETEY